jgi:hypothetical protein
MVMDELQCYPDIFLQDIEESNENVQARQWSRRSSKWAYRKYEWRVSALDLPVRDLGVCEYVSGVGSC